MIQSIGPELLILSIEGLDIRTFMSVNVFMNRQQFLKELRQTAKEDGVAFRIDKARGKDSHSTVHYGDKFTTVPQKLKTGTMRAIRKQLGIE